VSMDAIETQLDALESVGLVELYQTEPELEYLFRHVLIQEAAYASMVRHERRRLHHLVGEVLERRYVAGQRELAAVLALHFEQAGDQDQALDYLVAAAEYALERFANREALAFLDRAAALLPEGPTDPETMRRRALVYMRLAEAGENRMPLEKTLALLGKVRVDAEALGDNALLARMYLANGLERILRGEQIRSSEPLRTALEKSEEYADRTGNAKLAAMPRALLGEALHYSAEYSEAVRLLEDAIPVVEAVGRLDRASHHAGALAMSHAHLGHFDQAHYWLSKAIDFGDRSRDPLSIADAEIAQSMIAALEGDPRGAIEHAMHAADAAEGIDEKACAFYARVVAGEQHLMLGEAADAVPPLERAKKLASEGAMVPSLAARCDVLLRSALAQVERRPPSLEPHDYALALAHAAGDRSLEANLLRQRARDRIAAGGSVDLALADYAAGEAGFEALGIRPLLAETRAEHGRLLAQEGRLDDARDQFAQAANLYEEMGMASAAEAARNALANL
jgi:tetratricopeptide (TPR) repeat protein